MREGRDDIRSGVDVTDANQYLGIWFLAGSGQDWLCIVHRPKGELVWTFDYRFRYYADPGELNGFDPFDGQDRKSWWKGQGRGKTDAEIIEICDSTMARLVAKGYTRGTDAKPWRRVVKDRSFEAFLAILKAAPFMHLGSKDAYDAKPTTNERGQA